MKRRMTPKEELLEGAANIGTVLAFIGFFICGGAMNAATLSIGISFIVVGNILIFGFELISELAEKARKRKARKILRLADQIRMEMREEMWDATED